MIKILVTADWHLKAKHHCSTVNGEAAWDRWCQEKLNALWTLPDIAKKYNCDKVVIAGDVFDTSTPPPSLKAEFCKIISSIGNAIEGEVVIITGRPGDHDYVSENNYVLMDLKEAFVNSSNINIRDNNYYDVFEEDDLKKVLLSHEMLEGIDDKYKGISLSDERWKNFRTILLGDYHAYYKKVFGDKTFLYPGPPYPTRYGESNNSVCIIDIEESVITSIKRVRVKGYELITITDINMEHTSEDNESVTIPYIIKYKLDIKSQEISKVINRLNDIKKNNLKNKLCMDVIWEIKTDKGSSSKSSSNTSNLEDCCLNYIADKSPYPKSTTKLFQKLGAI